MLIGTQMNIFESIEFIFGQNVLGLGLVSVVLVVVHVVVVLGILAQMTFPEKSFIKSPFVTKLTINFINCYKNVAFIPIVHIVFKTLQ
jgi:hypothetical protein